MRTADLVRTIEFRLLANSGLTDTGCWHWVGRRDGSGYGRIGHDGKTNALAHRVSFEVFVEPIPDGMHLDHLCRNRACINPGHLQIVTPTENTMRGESFSAVNARKTTCPKGHPYTGRNLIAGAGRRYCRECTNERTREWKRQNRKAVI